VGITGNVETDGSGFVLLFDTMPGGQNTLNTGGFPSPPSAIPILDGTVLDAGFAPDVLIFANAYAAQLYVDRYTMPTSGLGEKRYVGTSAIDSGDGNLNGGNDFYGMELALNNSNTAGVTDTDTAGAATATSGLEGILPYEDLSLDPAADSVKVAVMMVRPNGEVGNQFLPGLGGGQGNLGIAPDLTDFPGDQYAEVSLTIPGDYDGDRDVDLTDFTFFRGCLVGPDGGIALGSGCEAFDFDGDIDVDLVDFSSFQVTLVEY
jgi:hypothetical protein